MIYPCRISVKSQCMRADGVFDTASLQSIKEQLQRAIPLDASTSKCSIALDDGFIGVPKTNIPQFARAWSRRQIRDCHVVSPCAASDDRLPILPLP